MKQYFVLGLSFIAAATNQAKAQGEFMSGCSWCNRVAMPGSYYECQTWSILNTNMSQPNGAFCYLTPTYTDDYGHLANQCHVSGSCFSNVRFEIRKKQLVQFVENRCGKRVKSGMAKEA